MFVRDSPSLREGYSCPSCHAALRYQGQAEILLRRYATGNASSVAELVSDPAFRRLHVWEPGLGGPLRQYLNELPNNVISYYWPDVAPGAVATVRSASEPRRPWAAKIFRFHRANRSLVRVRCEDLMALTFRADSFDLVITSDIFEHVRRPYAAFAELHRVLRPGGAHVFSVPVVEPMRSKTTPRVDVSGDDDVYLVEPWYHGGPGNSRHLVYNDFGKDLIDALSDIGFDTQTVAFPSVNPEAARLLTFCSVKR